MLINRTKSLTFAHSWEPLLHSIVLLLPYKPMLQKSNWIKALAGELLNLILYPDSTPDLLIMIARVNVIQVTI